MQLKIKGKDMSETPRAEVYTKPSCPYCVRAKNLLESKGISYIEHDAVAEREQLITRVTKDTGNAPRTVPQIYLDGKYVGGFDQLNALIG